MKRRDFLKTITACTIGWGLSTDALAGILKITPTIQPKNQDDHIKDYLHKMKNFNKSHVDDICLDQKKYILLKSLVQRLKRLQEIVGHGNFQLISLDDALKITRYYPSVGQFPQKELDFMEMIFFEDMAHIGFLDKKPVKNLTHKVDRNEVLKIPATGNYLYRGTPLETYKKIVKDIGEQVILTSGVRSVIKQFLLFLNKACKSQGNLSLASRSLAPPGYSFHGIGDFDVGQIGFGEDNFTKSFTTTKVYKKLEELGYTNFRYPQNNFLGVRFEPWHIKINSTG